MKRYETVLHIINYGEDRFDDGERAGELIDITRHMGEVIISCDPTKEIKEETGRHMFKFAGMHLVEVS